MAGMLAISPPPTSLKAIRVRARAGSRSCAKRFKARSKSVSHFEGLSKPGKCLLKRLLSSQVAQGRFYGPDATPHDLGDNPIRSEFNYTLENGQRTKLEETFYFDHDDDSETADIAKSTTYDWVYDANDRLLSETIDHHDDALDRTESFVMDLFGNRTNRTVDYHNTPAPVDEAFAYLYDNNDRLVTETFDDGDGNIDKTTRYSWDSTQQSVKEIFTGDSTAPANLVSSQSFAYDLQGRLAEVINAPETGDSTKVTYSYDSSGIRVSSSQFTDANENGVFETSELDHTVDYLVDHRNHTGYAQTIAETTTDGNGANVERLTYTFGSDELSQTTYTPAPADADAWLSEAMHYFGQDAHGSVRVLLDALGEIAQTFTYSAYGELLAIYEVTGSLVGTLGAADTSAALTNLLYSGESFDSRIGQQYLRARWYDAAAGRFSRLDPYFGTLNDPLSFNKFNYVHSNPVLGADPTGKFFSARGVSAATGIASRIGANLVQAAVRAATPTFALFRTHGFAIGAGAFVTRLLLGQGHALFSSEIKKSFAPIAVSLESLANSLENLQKMPSESGERFAARKERAVISAQAIQSLASDLSLGWRDTFEAVVGPFTDAQLGFAWNFLLPPPTAIVTGRWDPLFLRIPRLARTAYYSHYAIKDAIAVLPDDARYLASDAAWLDDIHPIAAIATTFDDPSKLANVIDNITRIVEAGPNASADDIRQLNANLEILRIAQPKVDND